jgi:Flp pilus assembly protein TadD
MNVKSFVIAMALAGASAGLVGCASAPPPPPPAPMADVPWRDSAFAFNAASVAVDKQTLFQLDAALLSEMAEAGRVTTSDQERLDLLIATVFGPERRSFPYSAGHSTVAAETWRRKKGDCLSLTVLTYALAKALGLSAAMQDVRVSPVFSRSGSIDLLSGHVNLLIEGHARLHLENHPAQAGDVILDFDPEIGWSRRGTILSENEILARYYNNAGAEYLAKEQASLAYAYFKAAILAAPNYASSYGNLAQLYVRAGFDADAEKLLVEDIALNSDDFFAMRSLTRLMESQGRQQEAAKYSQMLQVRQSRDPYYWIGVGLAGLNEGDPNKAVGAFERAQELTVGFAEVHRYLAIAYWRAGKREQADKQLAILTSSAPSDPGVAMLRKKFGLATP